MELIVADGFMIDHTVNPDLRSSTHHYDLLVVPEDGVAVDHADDGHAQVTSDTEGDAEADAGEDGDDVAPGQAEARAVHHRLLLLLHQLRPALRRQLNGLAILLLLLKSSVEGKKGGKRMENVASHDCLGNTSSETFLTLCCTETKHPSNL